MGAIWISVLRVMKCVISVTCLPNNVMSESKAPDRITML